MNAPTGTVAEALDGAIAALQDLKHALESGAVGQLRVGPLTVDPVTHAAAIDGHPLDLTHSERLLLATLARAGGVYVSGASLKAVLGYPAELRTRTHAVHLARLRSKLPEGMLATGRGVGYRLCIPAAVAA